MQRRDSPGGTGTDVGSCALNKVYHVDPTEALVRLLIAGPLAADPGNLQFFPNEGGLHHDDYADGERMARIQAALPSGSAALTSVLFFDKINRDKKGFSTGEGAILVGGFYKRYDTIIFTCARCSTIMYPPMQIWAHIRH